MKRCLSLAFALVLAAGCDQQEETDTTPAGTTGEPQAATEAPAENVVMQVNGQPITEEMVNFHLQRRAPGQAENLGPEQRDALMQELVDMVLLAQAAEEKGLMDDEDVQARLESIRQALLAQAAVERLQEEQPVSEADVQAEYEEAFGGEQAMEYKARHILLEDEAAAQEVIEQLNEGAEFAELAKEKSTGPSADAGGDLGWFQPEQMVPPFAEAVRELEPGNYTEEPVQTQFGWHVVLLEEERPVEPPQLEQVSEQLRNQLAQEQIQSYIEDLRQKANLVYTEPDMGLQEDEVDAESELSTSTGGAEPVLDEEEPADAAIAQ